MVLFSKIKVFFVKATITYEIHISESSHRFQCLMRHRYRCLKDSYHIR